MNDHPDTFRPNLAHSDAKEFEGIWTKTRYTIKAPFDLDQDQIDELKYAVKPFGKFVSHEYGTKFTVECNVLNQQRFTELLRNALVDAHDYHKPIQYSMFEDQLSLL